MSYHCNGPRDCIGTERGCYHCDPVKFVAQGHASYVLDWLRQTEAPSNIIRLQEKAVEQLGGYLGAIARQVR